MSRYTHHGLFCLVSAVCLGLAPAAVVQPVDVTTASIQDLNRAFATEALTSEQLVDLYLARIEAYDDRGPTLNAARYAKLTGFPADLIVPAGFTGTGLPVGISFPGRAFDEPRLLALDYAFEQATEARRLPVHMSPLED